MFESTKHTVQLNDHCIRLDEQTKVLDDAWGSLDNRHQFSLPRSDPDAKAEPASRI